MVHNPARRTALVEAAIEVLAGEGARGLTFRAVDAAADVPKGTASNYFANRDDLLNQAGNHVHDRLAPDPQQLAVLHGTPSREAVRELMHLLMARLRADRTGYLALLELRLEATRRPELRAMLTRTISANLAENIRAHLDAGLPGDATTVIVLYLAMSGLVVEHLTLPDVLPLDVIDDIVARIVPSESG